MKTVELSMFYLHRVQRVTPQPALETATKLAVELSNPILENIDPYDLGAFALDSDLAKEYCKRLCSPTVGRSNVQSEVDHTALVEQYPAHEFIIDIDEAMALGLKVEEPTASLDALFDLLRPFLDDELRATGNRRPADSQVADTRAINRSYKP